MTGAGNAPVVLVGSASGHLAAGLAVALAGGAAPPKVHRVERRCFPDGEICVRIGEDLDGRDVVVVQGTSSPQHENLMELYQLVEAAQALGARRIRCAVPYLAYARQDRRSRRGEAVSCLIPVRTLAELGASSVATLDVHNPAAYASAPIPLTNLSVVPLFAPWMRSWADGGDVVVVAPDHGSAGRAQLLAAAAGTRSVALAKHKEPDGRTSYPEAPPAVGDCDLVVLDDLCSSGSTLEPLLERLREARPLRIAVAVVHLLGDRNALRCRLGADVGIVSTNSVRPAPGYVSIEGLLAAWINEAEGRTSLPGHGR